MKKKIISALLCTALIGTMIAGCGSGNGGGSGTSDNANGVVDETAAVSEKLITAILQLDSAV